jgi:hypothetical protein
MTLDDLQTWWAAQKAQLEAQLAALPDAAIFHELTDLEAAWPRTRLMLRLSDYFTLVPWGVRRQAYEALLGLLDAAGGEEPPFTDWDTVRMRITHAGQRPTP